METSRLSSKGQVVVPKAVRNALQATPGAQLGFDITGDRAVIYVLRKKTGQTGDGYGLLKGKGRDVPDSEADSVLAAAMKKEARNARG